MMELSQKNKQWIFKLLAGQCSITAFEEWLYNNESLQLQLNPVIYNELLSFNYRSKDARYELSRLLIPQIKEYEYTKQRLKWITAKLQEFDKYDDELFESLRNHQTAYEYATEVIERFQGLNFYYKTTQKRIRFYDDLPIILRFNPWEQELGTLYCIATYNDDAGLMINHKGEFYIHYDIIDELYFFASDLVYLFKEVLITSTPKSRIEKWVTPKIIEQNTVHPLLRWINSWFA